MDNRGQGFSDKELPGKLHVENHQDFISDQQSFRQILGKQFPQNVPFTLMGHSLGGAIAARYAEEHPTDYSKLVMLSPMLDINTKLPKPVEEVAAWALNLAKRNDYAFGETGYNPTPAFDGNHNTASKERFEFVQAQYRRNPETQVDGVTNHWLEEGMRLDRAVLSPKNAAALKQLSGGVHLFVATEDLTVQPEAEVKLAAALGVEPERFASRHELLQAPDTVRDSVMGKLRAIITSP